MITEPKNLNLYLTEFVAAGKTVLQKAEEAAELYAAGDAQGACNAVNVMHYKTGHLEHLRLAVARDFEEQGFKPGLNVGG